MGRVDKYKDLRQDIKKGRVEQAHKDEPSFRKRRKPQAQRALRKLEEAQEASFYEECPRTQRNIRQESPRGQQMSEESESFAPKMSAKEAKQAEKTARKSRRKRRRKGCLRVFLVLLLLIIALVAYGVFSFQKSLKKAEESRPAMEHFEGQTSPNGAKNILILGVDQRDDQNSGEARSDSIMVLQLDGPSKRPKLISFMRDTLVFIPNVGGDNKINNAFTIGEQYPYDGSGVGQGIGQGAELMRETLKQNFDIDCKYYAMVNFSSFAHVIDALFPKGVEIEAKFATVDGQVVTQVEVPDDLRAEPGQPPPNQTIQVGLQKMDGRTLLNYARFRHDDENDFGRVKRQQQVLGAILSQAKDPATLFNGPNAIGKVMGYTASDVPNMFMINSVIGVLSGKDTSVAKLTIPLPDGYEAAWDVYGGEALRILDIEATNAKIKEFLNE